MSVFSNLPRLSTWRLRVAAIGGALALSGVTASLLLAAGPVFASNSGQRHGASPAAASKWPFHHADPVGASLLGEGQVLAHIGWKPGDRVGIARLSYQRANARYPDLAADTGAIAPSRVVWVVTVYFPRPVTIPFAGGWGPPSNSYPATQKISAVSSVIDARTGQTTDSGTVAEVPASPAATRLAAAVASAG